MEKQLKESLDSGIIELANSPYCLPEFLVTKSQDSQGNKRYGFVVHFRQLNDKKIEDKYPLLSIADIIDYVAGTRILLDVRPCIRFFSSPDGRIR